MDAFAHARDQIAFVKNCMKGKFCLKIIEQGFLLKETQTLTLNILWHVNKNPVQYV